MSYIFKTIIGGIIFLLIVKFTFGLDLLLASVYISFGILAGVYVFVSYFVGVAFFYILAFFGHMDYRHLGLDKALTLVLLLLVLSYIGVSFKARTLPALNEIHKDLIREPIQSNTSRLAFEFDYRDSRYKVIPKADYELWGLVVSVNDINKWYNYYHDENTVNLKDVCVVWGDNITLGAYDDIKVKSGEWTCYVRYSYNDEGANFKGDKLSNNHLLTADEDIQEKIKNVHIGDQIRFKGVLANYGKTNLPEKYFRSSSLSRTDTGNGACETVYLDEFEVLVSNNKIYYLIKEVLLYLIYALLALKLIRFFI